MQIMSLSAPFGHTAFESTPAKSNVTGVYVQVISAALGIFTGPSF